MTLTRAGRASDVRSARRLLQAVGLIFYILSVQGMFTAGVGIYVFFQGGGSGRDLILPATGAALALSYAFVGYFLRRYFVWARNFTCVFSVIAVFFFPIGTVLGSVMMLSVDRANRAGLFPARPALPDPDEAEETAPILRFEPDLSESAG